jgi:hypothetical protein
MGSPRRHGTGPEASEHRSPIRTPAPPGSPAARYIAVVVPRSFASVRLSGSRRRQRRKNSPGRSQHMARSTVELRRILFSGDGTCYLERHEFSAKVSVWRKKRLTHMPQQSEDVSKALEAARSWLAGPPYQINILIKKLSRSEASTLLCFGVAVSVTERLFWNSGRRPGMLDPCEHPPCPNFTRRGPNFTRYPVFPFNLEVG